MKNAIYFTDEPKQSALGLQYTTINANKCMSHAAPALVCFTNKTFGEELDIVVNMFPVIIIHLNTFYFTFILGEQKSL